MTRRIALYFIPVLGALALAVSCSLLPADLSRAPADTPTRTSVRAARATTTPTPAPTAVGPTSGFTEKVNLDEFSPPGRGRDLVIMNCDYCHPWICALRNQRTLDHWTMVEDVHKGREWVILSDDDWNTLFLYLERNFNDQKPEPDFPPVFQKAGCTHSSYR